MNNVSDQFLVSLPLIPSHGYLTTITQSVEDQLLCFIQWETHCNAFCSYHSIRPRTTAMLYSVGDPLQCHLLTNSHHTLNKIDVVDIDRNFFLQGQIKRQEESCWSSLQGRG
jgi:hypothetical protein